MTTALDARVYGVNVANDFANHIFPGLVEAFTPFVGKQIERQDGDLLVKVQKVVKELNLDELARTHVSRIQRDEKGLFFQMPEFPTTIMVYRSSSSRYSLVYVVKTCSHFAKSNGDSNSFYHEVSMYVGDMFNGVLQNVNRKELNLKTDYSAEQIKQARLDYKQAEKALENARSALHPFGEFDR